MTAVNSPKLSIGLPVYNGEKYLQHALDSILSQTFVDYELIICDNASTDETARICQEYASRDDRIRYHRNQENIGAAGNFNLAFGLSRAPYFKWAAADDTIAPDFLEKCIQVLDEHPDIVLSYTKVDRINAAGQIDGVYDFPMRIDSPSVIHRFSDLILVNHFCVAVFGVIRSESLSKTPLIGRYVGSDRVLLAELGLHGKLFETQEYLFHRRDHPQASGRMFNIYKRLAWFDPSNRQKINLVHWKVALEYSRAIGRVPLSASDKAACYRVLTRWLVKQRNALFEDIKAALLQILPFSYSLVKYYRKFNEKKINSGGRL